MATTMFKILEHPTPIPSPVALVFSYGALDFNFTCESSSSCVTFSACSTKTDACLSSRSQLG